MSLKKTIGVAFKQIIRFLARGLKWFCILIGGVILTCFVIGLTIGGFAAHYIFSNHENLPDIQAFISFDVPQVGIINDTKGRPIINLAKEYRLVIRPEEIPWPVRTAFLSAEDKDFYNHNGIDRLAMVRATERNLFHTAKKSIANKQLTIVIQQGASTITDQLAGLYYKDLINTALDRLTKKWWGFLPRQYLKKMEELRLAVWLEKELAKPEYFNSKRRAKDEILARFLSYTYFRKVYGVKAASLYYFGKNVEYLDYGEAALLAGIPKTPNIYAPVVNPPNNLFIQRQLNRRNSVLDLMTKNGYLTQVEADKFKELNIPIPEDKRSITDAPSIVGGILSELKTTGVNADKLFSGEVKIYSTSNSDIQIIANNALENGLRAFEKRYPESKNVIQGSVVILRNNDAAILAEVGGRKLYNNQAIKYTDFNRVRYSLRQSGSAFKPFVYLTALMYSFWSLDDKVMDKPISVPMGWKKPKKWISNYDGKFKGEIPLRKALAESRNAATIWIVRRTGGIEKTIEVAQYLGIKTKLQPYITTALGASEVNLLELANAYRAIASGIAAEPYVIEKVVNQYGEALFSHQIATQPLLKIDESVLELIQEGLRGVVRIPGGTAHSLDNKDFPISVAGKTGTTNNSKDASFFGWTYGSEGITVGIRVGFDEPSIGYDENGAFGTGPGRGLGDKETGARVALPIFKEIIREIYAREPIGPPPEFPPQMEENIKNYIINLNPKQTR